jgi:fluoride exporter
MIKELIIVGAGGALGAISRYLVYISATKYLGLEFPYGTLIVNIFGSFLMGVLIELWALTWDVTMQTRLFLAVGFLGAFTTFSTFSLDVSVLYERKEITLTAIYIVTSVVFSIGALFSGLVFVRRLIPS